MDQQNNWTIIILPGNPSDRCGMRNRLWQGARGGWLSATAGGSTARTHGLNRRARNRAVGTEHTTIARLRPQRRAAATACIEKLARIGRHGLRFRGGTMRTSDDGFKNHGPAG
jgi:hypothetical protein